MRDLRPWCHGVTRLLRDTHARETVRFAVASWPAMSRMDLPAWMSRAMTSSCYAVLLMPIIAQVLRTCARQQVSSKPRALAVAAATPLDELAECLGALRR